MLYKAFKQSIGLLLALYSVISMVIVIVSTLMYYTERHASLPDNSPSKFTSIPASFWWAIVTMATVGYGGIIPQTSLGKIIASFTIGIGILLIALPSMIISKHLDFTNHLEDVEGSNNVNNLEFLLKKLKKHDKLLKDHREQMKMLIDESNKTSQHITDLIDKINENN